MPNGLFPIEQCHRSLDEPGSSGSLDRKQSGEVPPEKKGHSSGNSAIFHLSLARYVSGQPNRLGIQTLDLY